jgi:hypothetical protein
MTNTIDYKKAYSEVDTFIELLNDENKKKVPKELIDFFKKEKDPNYKKVIDPNKPIKEQNLSQEALSIIAYLNLTYWCEDENEKNELIEIYNQNEKRYFFDRCTKYLKKRYHI